MKSSSKQPLKLMEAHELLSFFDQNDNKVQNKQKISLQLHAPETILAIKHLKNNKDRYTLALLTDYQSLNTFINAHEIKTFADINTNVGSSQLWWRYLKGDGYVACDLESRQTEICFRIVKGITTVYSLSLHYYDEINKALSLPEQFEAYIEGRWELWCILSEMRDDVIKAELLTSR